MEKEINDILKNHNSIQDPIISEKIELKIQKLYNISIPSIILEYLSPENEIFELEDLKQFFNHFGEVLNILIIDKKAIVLFKTFFIANICKEFLQSDISYKENMKKNFNVRWFDYEKDMELLVPTIKPLFIDIYNKNIINLKQNLIDSKSMSNPNNENNNIGIKMNMNMNINNFNINTTMNPIAQNQNMIPNLQYFQLLQLAQMKMNKNIQNNNNFPQVQGTVPNYNFPVSPIQIQQQQNLMNPIALLMNKQNLNNINNPNNINKVGEMNILNMNMINNMNLMNNMNNNINNQLKIQNLQQKNNPQFNQGINQKNFNQNINNNNDEKNLGKYTCKYEILIANDKDFQIARRLIGSKGCNMKNIINECKSSGDGEGIKLRLRGKGSGYKEGPENKESDEPLHLCVSSKNPEEMKKVCLLVDELLDKIHQDYKEYCEKNNVTPLSTEIATRIENKNLNYKSK